MKKLLLKTFLLAVGLLAGTSASWAGTETYEFAQWTYEAGGDQKSFTFSSSPTATVNSANCYTYESALNGHSLNGRFAVSNTHKNSGVLDHVWFRLNKSSASDKYTGHFVGSNRNTYFAILNLKEGNKVTITFNNLSSGTLFYSSNATYDDSGIPTAIVSGTTAPVSGKQYTMTSDGVLGLYLPEYSCIKTVVIETDDETVSAPSAVVASVNGTTGARTLTVTDGVSSASKTVTTYWSASTELTESNYSSAGTAVVSNTITTTSDMVYLFSISTTGANSGNTPFNVANSVRLKAPSVALKSVTHKDGWLKSPTFTINATANTGIVGTPTSALYYTFTPDGGAESSRTAIDSGGEYTPTAYGTLKVYATATGYAENSYSIPVSDYYSSEYEYDYSAVSAEDGATIFGASNTRDVSTDWWSNVKAYAYSPSNNNATVGWLRIQNAYVTHLVIGYGVGRPGSSGTVQVRYNKLGNIQTLTIKNNNSSGVTSGTFYHDDLGTSGSGGITDLTSEYGVPSYNTVAKHNCYVPAKNPITAAIADCKANASSAFATAVDAESFASAAEVYAFHTAWQIAQAKASGSVVDLTKVILDAGVTSTTNWTGSRVISLGDEKHDSAPDNYIMDANNQVLDAYQIVYGLPAGKYIVKAATRATTAVESGKIYVYADGQVDKNASGHHVGNTGGDLGHGWGWTEIEFELTATSDVKFGYYVDASSSKWASCDDWHLYVESVSATITAAGWTTFSSLYALDLSNLEGSKAYYASEASGSKVRLTATNSNAVAAGEGIMLKGTANANITIPVVETGTAISGNLLKGQTTTATVDASNKEDNGLYHYVFGFNTADPSIYGFYNLTADTEVPAGKAYLETTTALTAKARIAIVFDDETTAVSEEFRVKSDEFATAPVYNLKGQRVAQPVKGLYIKNGKKVVVK